MTFKETDDFRRAFKRLRKKYPNIGRDLNDLLIRVRDNPIEGDALGDSCYKVRMPISDKQKGKSGGARVITCVKIIEDTIHLLYIFDKSEMDNISDAFLKELIKTTS
jgi:hypothetical protein